MSEVDRTVLIEEFKVLKHEIDQNQRDGMKIIEVGLVATAGLLGFAFSEFVAEAYRWVFLFAPWLVLFPLTMLMAQRVRQSWIIGRYVQRCLEPKLGFNWERLNFEGKIGRRNRRLVIPFVWGTAGSFLFIQAACPLLSLLTLLALPAGEREWGQIAGWAIFTLAVIATLALQVFSIGQANHPERYALMDSDDCSPKEVDS